MSDGADLGFLYPALRGTTAGTAERLDEDLLGSVAEKARQSRDANARVFDEQAPVLVAAAKALAETYRRGGRLFSMGNGGSSCDAAHVAVEFLHPVTAGRLALEAVDLTADTAMLLAVGNDVGFEHVFVRQIIARARAGDALIGFSTSGDSENLIAAYAKARELGLTTLGMAGGNGGRMAASGLVDHCLVVPTASIHRVQECHVAAYHILWDLTHTLLACDRGPSS
jgi:D-sedoheptulose 7-phosphate isomerase